MFNQSPTVRKNRQLWGTAPERSSGRFRFTNFVAAYADRHAHKQIYSGPGFLDHPDWLGTEHWITTNTGTSYGHCVSDPFGDQLYCGTAEGELSPVHLTGKERDWANQESYTNLDNFGARYYTSNIGRFMSPDWAARPTAVPYAVVGDPQSLNLYTYVRGDPVTVADLDGHTEAIAAINVSPGGGLDLSTTVFATPLLLTENELEASEPATNLDNPPTTPPSGPDQAKAQQTSATVTTVKYAATDGGVEILLLAKVTGSNYQDFNWVQTVTTNDPSPGKAANKPYADTDPGQKTPFYLNPKEQKQGEAIAKANGGSTVFSDRPNRVFSGKTISWRANLSLVGINKNGHFDRLRSFSYGFTLDTKGVHLLPLKETQ